MGCMTRTCVSSIFNTSAIFDNLLEVTFPVDPPVAAISAFIVKILPTTRPKSFCFISVLLPPVPVLFVNLNCPPGRYSKSQPFNTSGKTSSPMCHLLVCQQHTVSYAGLLADDSQAENCQVN